MTAYEMRISDWSSDVCSFDLESFCLILVVVSVEQRVAQLFNLVGDIDAAVGDDAFEDADAFLQPFGMRRILRRFLGCHLRLLVEHLALVAGPDRQPADNERREGEDRKSTRLNSSH